MLDLLFGKQFVNNLYFIITVQIIQHALMWLLFVDRLTGYS